MTNFSKMLNQMGGMYSDERFRYISSLSRFSLLIIDDLGIERSTDYAKEQVYSIVDERYKSGLPVIHSDHEPDNRRPSLSAAAGGCPDLQQDP